MTTKRQYLKAIKTINKANADIVKAMRSGDQAALDRATEIAAAALAVVANYKDEQASKR